MRITKQWIRFALGLVGGGLLGWYTASVPARSTMARFGIFTASVLVFVALLLLLLKLLPVAEDELDARRSRILLICALVLPTALYFPLILLISSIGPWFSRDIGPLVVPVILGLFILKRLWDKRSRHA
jgi:hypothetical protein